MYGKLLVVLGLISAVSSTDYPACLQKLAEKVAGHIEQGSVPFGNSNTYQVSGNDKRSVQTIKFAKPYGTPPTVVVTVETMDASKDTNLRYSVAVGQITTTGAQITLATWADTQIFGAYVRWYAFD
ncbi:uncharacterized protein LOC131930856 [Physella acuta]|uniref:uncharacterized protein LOC131930856 n=1 Tax=Physella acuta TaxID=109671 RepID=UPI0027DBFD89|nr:uncharacterized protein LOC131930856 [Physella acuta]